MKKYVLIAAILNLSIMACKKESTAPQLNSVQMDIGQDYSYMATDNSRANVTFQGKGVNHTMTIKSNKIKYVLDKKKNQANAEIYERNGVTAKLTKDSLIITQDNMEISLVRLN